MGRALKGTRVILLVAGRDIRVLSSDGQLLRQLTLDPSRDYQPQTRTEGVHYAPRHLSTMTRDTTVAEGVGLEPTSPLGQRFSSYARIA